MISFVNGIIRLFQKWRKNHTTNQDFLDDDTQFMSEELKDMINWEILQ